MAGMFRSSRIAMSRHRRNQRIPDECLSLLDFNKRVSEACIGFQRASPEGMNVAYVDINKDIKDEFKEVAKGLDPEIFVVNITEEDFPKPTLSINGSWVSNISYVFSVSIWDSRVDKPVYSRSVYFISELDTRDHLLKNLNEFFQFVEAQK